MSHRSFWDSSSHGILLQTQVSFIRRQFLIRSSFFWDHMNELDLCQQSFLWLYLYLCRDEIILLLFVCIVVHFNCAFLFRPIVLCSRLLYIYWYTVEYIVYSWLLYIYILISEYVLWTNNIFSWWIQTFATLHCFATIERPT